MPTKTEIAEYSDSIEKLTSKLGTPYLDAILWDCEKSGMEVDVASTLLSSALKAKIREQAQDANMLKRTSKLPV